MSEPSAVWSNTLLAVYCLLIVASSLVGGWLPSAIRLTHRRMQVIISFVGGLMLGVALFHLLPHATRTISVQHAVHYMMFGILTMFFLMRALHVHHHGPLELPDQSGTVIADSYRHQLQPPGGAHEGHDHGGPPVDEPLHHHHGCGGHSHHEVNTLSWVGIAMGLGVHTLIDGMLLGAGVKADADRTTATLAGFGTFLAVGLHKPLDALSITSLMAAAGWSRRSRMTVNTAFAVICPLGTVLFLLGIEQFAGYQAEIVAGALAFAAGVFVCIALGDLLPEMELHSHSRVPLTVALLAGIALAWGATFLESGRLQ